MQKPRRLKDSHWTFVKEFVSTGSRQNAALKCGFVGDNHALSVKASQLLMREDVKDAILKYTEYLDNPTVDIEEDTPGKPAEVGPSLLKLKTRDQRLEWLATIILDSNDKVDPPPWTVRMAAFKMLGDMHGDFLVSNRNMEKPESQTINQIIITDGEARDVLSGKKTVEEVISARNGSGNRLGGGSGDVIDVILDDDSDAP